MCYLYLIECSDKSYYLGVTNDLSRRIKEHQDGININCYTFKRRPIKLEHYLEYNTMSEAIYDEKKLKKWSRAKKVAYFKKQWTKLHKLARCLNNSSYTNYEESEK